MDYQKGRSRAGPLKWLAGYAGALQSDGYAAYDEFCTRKEITGYACWAHARRHIIEAKDSSPKQAEYALREIQRLYGLERGLRRTPRLRSAGASGKKRPFPSLKPSKRGWRRTGDYRRAPGASRFTMRSSVGIN
jgi:Transposase IS66 family